MSTQALQVPQMGSQARAEGMPAELFGAGRTDVLQGVGTAGIYNLIVLHLPSLWFVIVIRHWKL